jgi:hypothetical protein
LPHLSRLLQETGLSVSPGLYWETQPLPVCAPGERTAPLPGENDMKLMMRALAAVCLLSILLILIGCGGGSSPSGGGTPPPPTSAQYLFATSNATVLTFSMDTSSGALTLKANGPSAPGNFGIAASPSASFLYTSDAMTGGVAGFSISSSGTLTAVSGSPFPLPNDPPGSTFPPMDSLAMHPSAKFLFAPILLPAESWDS